VFIDALAAQSSETPEDEAAVLARALNGLTQAPCQDAKTESNKADTEEISGVQFELNGPRTRLTLSGDGLTDQLIEDLRHWLSARS